MVDASKMYKEIIMDHYKNPRNYGSIDNPDLTFKGENQSCGDKIEVYLNINDGKIKNIKFESTGCAISKASMSMLSQDLAGEDVDYILDKERDDIIDMLGIELTPTRVKCAVLGNELIKDGIEDNI